MDFILLGNSCVSGWVYWKQEIINVTPIVWHVIPDDKAFLKLCKNYYHYINKKPTFVNNDLSYGRWKHSKVSKTYPIMKLGDILIHFIHHEKKEIVLKNFYKRRDKTQNKDIVPILWDKEIFNNDKNEIISEFKKLQNNILISKVNSQKEAADKIIQILKND